jgi:hypothetical protein
MEADSTGEESIVIGVKIEDNKLHEVKKALSFGIASHIKT